MSNKRLGKGLEALIQPYSAEKIPDHHGVDKISIRSIKPNPHLTKLPWKNSQHLLRKRGS